MQSLYKAVLVLFLVSLSFYHIYGDGDTISTPVYAPPVMKMYPKSSPKLEIPGRKFSRIDFIKNGEFQDTEFDMNNVFLYRLSQETFDTVVSYYKKMMKKDDSIEETPASTDNDFRRTIIITYNAVYDNGPAPAATVTISIKDMDVYSKVMKQYGGEAVLDAMLPYPLMMMRNLIGMHGHTQVEFDALKLKYRYISQYQSPRILINDKEKDKTEAIQMKYLKKVYGVSTEMTDEQFELYLQKASMNPKTAQKMFSPEVWTAGVEALAEMEALAYKVSIEHDPIEYWE